MSYKLLDYESGDYYEVTKEQYEAHQRMIGSFKDMLKQNMVIKGKVFVTSTMADESSNEDFKKLWTNQ